MTERDPNSCGDRRPGSDEPLELPLELFFAEDRGDPDARAANDSLAAGVLDRVASERGFVSGRERGLIRVWRGAVLACAACVLLAAAVADRLAVAPWSEEPDEGPVSGLVSGLVSSTSQQTSGKIEQVRELRDQLIQAVSLPAVESRQDTTLTVPLRPMPVTRARAGTELTSDSAAGPYLTAEGFGVGRGATTTVTTIIRFEDGFSVPAMAGEKPSELRWPASRDVTHSMIPLDGGNASARPGGLSPAWYAKRNAGPSR